MDETREVGAETRVGRRAVFFVPGFDPLSARRYRELYRAEGARQAAISGYRLEVTGLPGAGPYAWAARFGADGAETVARIEVLAWNDIVRATLARPIPRIYLLMLRTLWRFGASGALRAMIRLRPGPMLAGLAPVGFMLLYLLAALLLGLAAAALVGAAGGPAPAAAAAGAAVFAGAMALTRRLDRVLFAYYLVCDFGHVASEGGALPADLAARIDGFADRVSAALAAGETDEVLVVGHSSGAHLAVSLVAGVLRRGRPPAAPPLALLTLGQAIPMASFLPRATALRRDLRALAAAPALTWVDVSSFSDGASFALTDPVAVSGVAPEGQRWPLVISAAFGDTLSPARRRHLRFRYFARHIQYLRAFDRPRDYDYFAITAGPRTLADRFRGRRPSPSVERRTFSPYRDV